MSVKDFQQLPADFPRRVSGFVPLTPVPSRLTVKPASLPLSPANNFILDNISPAARARLRRHLRHIKIDAQQMLFQEGDLLTHIYLPHEGLISLLTTLEDGTTVESVLVGREGSTGLEALLGSDSHALTQGIAQISGRAARLPLSLARAEFARGGSFQKIILSYLRLTMQQLHQSTISNVRNTIEQRLSCWLLLVDDRVQLGRLPLTHEVISSLLGVRRAGVSVAAQLLQGKKYLRYARGQVVLLNRSALEELAGECYLRMKTEFYRYMRRNQEGLRAANRCAGN